jgi:hypothetical protein
MTETTNPSRFDHDVAMEFQEVALKALLRHADLRGIVVIFDYHNELNLTDTISGIWQTRSQNEKSPSELFGGIGQTTRMLEGMIQHIDTMVSSAQEKMQVLLVEAKRVLSQTHEQHE